MPSGDSTTFSSGPSCSSRLISGLLGSTMSRGLPSTGSGVHVGADGHLDAAVRSRRPRRCPPGRWRWPGAPGSPPRRSGSGRRAARRRPRCRRRLPRRRGHRVRRWGSAPERWPVRSSGCRAGTAGLPMPGASSRLTSAVVTSELLSSVVPGQAVVGDGGGPAQRVGRGDAEVQQREQVARDGGLGRLGRVVRRRGLLDVGQDRRQLSAEQRHVEVACLGGRGVGGAARRRTGRDADAGVGDAGSPATLRALRCTTSPLARGAVGLVEHAAACCRRTAPIRRATGRPARVRRRSRRRRRS